MKNTCVPFNDKRNESMIDVSIIFENNKYKVFGLTEDFVALVLGEFENVFDAYECKLSYGFDGAYYEKAISPFENKVIEIIFD